MDLLPRLHLWVFNIWRAVLWHLEFWDAEIRKTNLGPGG